MLLNFITISSYILFCIIGYIAFVFIYLIQAGTFSSKKDNLNQRPKGPEFESMKERSNISSTERDKIEKLVNANLEGVDEGEPQFDYDTSFSPVLKNDNREVTEEHDEAENSSNPGITNSSSSSSIEEMDDDDDNMDHYPTAIPADHSDEYRSDELEFRVVGTLRDDEIERVDTIKALIEADDMLALDYAAKHEEITAIVNNAMDSGLDESEAVDLLDTEQKIIYNIFPRYAEQSESL